MNGGLSGSVDWIARGPAVAVAGGGTATIAGDGADHAHSRQPDDAGGARRLCVPGIAEPISIGCSGLFLERRRCEGAPITIRRHGGGIRRKHAVRTRAAGWSPAGVAAKEL